MVSNRVYGALKYGSAVVLPALATLYFALAQIWGLSNAENVVGTIAVANTFLGVVMGISTKSYNNSDSKYDGTMVRTIKENGNQRYVLELNNDPRALERKEQIMLKVEDR